MPGLRVTGEIWHLSVWCPLKSTCFW